MKKCICILLAFCLAFTVSTACFAANVGSNETMASLPWWARYGIKVVLNHIGVEVERSISLDSSTTYEDTYVELVSPDIDFNDGETAHSFWFEPDVTSDVYKIRMFAHRVLSVDVFSNIALTLRDANMSRVLTDNVSTHEMATYYPESSDEMGTWEACFTTNDSDSWQLFYQHFYDEARASSANIISTQSDVLGKTGVYFGNNRVYLYAPVTQLSTYELAASNRAKHALNMSKLNDQFKLQDGTSVNYMNDYNPGDTVLFSDVIHSVEYEALSNTTTFNFVIDDEIVGWKFSGDYSATYYAGDTLELDFQVVATEHFGDYVFESIDYFEDAYAHLNGGNLPLLSEYLH